jgi:hypothetical protein
VVLTSCLQRGRVRCAHGDRALFALPLPCALHQPQPPPLHLLLCQHNRHAANLQEPLSPLFSRCNCVSMCGTGTPWPPTPSATTSSCFPLTSTLSHADFVTRQQAVKLFLRPMPLQAQLLLFRHPLHMPPSISCSTGSPIAPESTPVPTRLPSPSAPTAPKSHSLAAARWQGVPNPTTWRGAQKHPCSRVKSRSGLQMESARGRCRLPPQRFPLVLSRRRAAPCSRPAADTSRECHEREAQQAQEKHSKHTLLASPSTWLNQPQQ